MRFFVTTLFCLSLLAVPAYPQAPAPAPAAQASAQAPTPIDPNEQVQLLKLQRQLAQLIAEAQEARATLAEFNSKHGEIQARIQQYARSLQQKYGAVGYNLNVDTLEWVKDPSATRNPPAAAAAPEPPEEAADAETADRPEPTP